MFMFKNGLIFTVVVLLLSLVVYMGIQGDRAYTRRLIGVSALEKRVYALEGDVDELKGVSSTIVFLMSNCVSVVCAQQRNMNAMTDLCSNMARIVEIRVFGGAQ